jgi:hypothetical protein
MIIRMNGVKKVEHFPLDKLITLFLKQGYLRSHHKSHRSMIKFKKLFNTNHFYGIHKIMKRCKRLEFCGLNLVHLKKCDISPMF